MELLVDETILVGSYRRRQTADDRTAVIADVHKHASFARTGVSGHSGAKL